MFFLIGLGLCDEKDITVRGLETVKKCSRIYLEAYTSILLVNKDRLVGFAKCGAPIYETLAESRKRSMARALSSPIATW